MNRWLGVLGPNLRSGNDTRELIDGPEAFAAMRRAIGTAQGAGHYVYLLGWWLDLDVPLDGPGTTIRQLFTARRPQVCRSG